MPSLVQEHTLVAVFAIVFVHRKIAHTCVLLGAGTGSPYIVLILGP